jgi:hypothetical protein
MPLHEARTRGKEPLSPEFSKEMKIMAKTFHYGLMINGEFVGVGVDVGLQEAINSLLEDFIAHAIPMGGKIGHLSRSR